jgi:chemotaxis regulatin CheY-phosphate phosphatase CheZ
MIIRISPAGPVPWSTALEAALEAVDLYNTVLNTRAQVEAHADALGRDVEALEVWSEFVLHHGDDMTDRQLNDALRAYLDRVEEMQRMGRAQITAIDSRPQRRLLPQGRF